MEHERIKLKIAQNQYRRFTMVRRLAWTLLVAFGIMAVLGIVIAVLSSLQNRHYNNAIGVLLGLGVPGLVASVITVFCWNDYEIKRNPYEDVQLAEMRYHQAVQNYNGDTPQDHRPQY